MEHQRVLTFDESLLSTIYSMGMLCRRAADVRSVGYSELFSLTKEDVLAATKDYPEAEVQC